ncbi:MAG TPA: hypothetical protein ENJ18_05240, partial [Nannocystis exedens]|nr:hypothetical protein [Nannocystis exedens]
MLSGNERVPRRLVIPEAVQSALAKLLAVESWLASGGTKGTLVVPARDYEIGIGAIVAAERELDGRFSDEMLAVFAAELSILGEVYGMRPELCTAHTSKGRAEGVPDTLIVVGNDRGRSFLCMSSAPLLGERPRLVIVTKDGASTRRELLASWLVDRIEEALDDLELSPLQLRHLNSDEVLEAFVPCIGGGTRTDLAEAGLRRVAHPKFGDGTVIREVLGGPEPKLEI